jgi:RNA polymerase sigma-70 factor (ECF subfamily)
MSGSDQWAEAFERLRPHLTSVAYSMLGTVSEAEDAVQESWIRLHRSDQAAINDLKAWLTTVVARVCLDLLRARRARREVGAGAWLPEPVVSELREGGSPTRDGRDNEPREPGDSEPEQRALLADAVGLALLVVLENLSPAERLAFVLHDVFGLPFAEIGQIVGRDERAARQLASRGRRRVRAAPEPDTDPTTQRRAVDAFLAAARGGDFEGLLRILDPDVVLRFDLGPDSPVTMPTRRGAAAVADQVMRTAPLYADLARPVRVNGLAGLQFGPPERPLSVLHVTVSGGRIVALDLVIDPAKVHPLVPTDAPTEVPTDAPAGVSTEKRPPAGHE